MCHDSVRMRENTDQKNSEYGHFSDSTPNVDYKNFQNTSGNRLHLIIPFLSTKKWETKLAYFGKFSVICKENITAINIRYIYYSVTIIYRE